MDGEKKRLLLDGEIAEADLMRFGWIGERRDLPRGRDGADKSKFGLRRLLELLWMPIG